MQSCDDEYMYYLNHRATELKQKSLYESYSMPTHCLGN